MHSPGYAPRPSSARVRQPAPAPPARAAATAPGCAAPRRSAGAGWPSPARLPAPCTQKLLAAALVLPPPAVRTAAGLPSPARLPGCFWRQRPAWPAPADSAWARSPAGLGQSVEQTMLPGAGTDGVPGPAWPVFHCSCRLLKHWLPGKAPPAPLPATLSLGECLKRAAAAPTPPPLLHRLG